MAPAYMKLCDVAVHVWLLPALRPNHLHTEIKSAAAGNTFFNSGKEKSLDSLELFMKQTPHLSATPLPSPLFPGSYCDNGEEESRRFRKS